MNIDIGTGQWLNGKEIVEPCEVKSQHVNVFTLVPDWVGHSDSPQIGNITGDRVTGGEFYYLCAPWGASMQLTQRAQGTPIE